jgi:hypothetical protein
MNPNIFSDEDFTNHNQPSAEAAMSSDGSISPIPRFSKFLLW